MSEQGEFSFGTGDPMLDRELSQAATDDAVYRATFLTDDEQKQAYFEAIVEAARRHSYFTSDQVWEVLGKVGDDVRDNGSGLGPVMREAQNAHVMVSTGRTRNSQRPCQHENHITIWRSLMYGSNLPVPPSAPGKRKEQNVTIEMTTEDLAQVQEAAAQAETCMIQTKTTDGETVWLRVQNMRRRAKRGPRAEPPAPPTEMPQTQTA